MTDRQIFNILHHAAKVGAAAMTTTVLSCIDAIEKEDLENEDAEKVIKMYLVPYSDNTRARLHDQIVEGLNERR